MKRKNLKTYAFILVSALTVLSSCETSARYIGSNEWSGSVNQVSAHPNWLPIGQAEVNNSSTWWAMTNLSGDYSSYEGIYLYEDITLTSTDYNFWQNSGSSVTLCLHGYTITGVDSNVDTFSDGGVISVGSTSTFTIQDCVGEGTIQANKSVDSGGVIKVNEGATLNLEGGTLTGGSATYDGGGIYCYEGTVNINGGSISSNKAEKGAGIYNDGGTLSITGGTIESNAATQEGGGVYSGPYVDTSTSPTTTTDATFTMTRGTIEGNTASDGAGIYSEGDLSLTASASNTITITGNTALYDVGGVKFNKFGGENHDTQQDARITLGGNVIIYYNYTCDGNSSLLTSGATTEYNLELSSFSLITFSDDSLGSDSKIGITYLGLYGDTYQISTNSDTNAISYLSIDNNSDYSDYYTVVSENSENHLELTYKTGVGTKTIDVTLEFTFYYDGVIDTSFPSGYGELYIVGDWDDYAQQTDLTYDSTSYTFSTTLEDLTVDIHYYELHLSYLINHDDDPLYNYDQDGQLSFKIPVSVVDSDSTSVTIPISLELDQKLEDYIPESGNIEKASCTVVFRWYSFGNPLDPQTLEWGDMYIYSDLYGDWGWSKCNVEEIDGTSYYTLELDNIEATEYEYSAVLINNNEEIEDADVSDDAWWTSHRVDYNDEYGTNSTFTPVAADEPIKYIDHDATQADLSSILPESGYLVADGTESITLSLNLTYNGTTVTCPSYGSLYIIGSWHVDASEAWDEWDKLTYNSDTGLYVATLDSADLIYATTYEYDICFVYDNQPFDWWTNKLTQPGEDIENDYNRHMTFSWKDSETLSHDDSCTLDIDPSSLGELSKGTTTEPMTVYFNIIDESSGDVYQTAYGNDLFVCGSWDSWVSFYECEYDEDYIVSYDVVYMVNLPVESVGSYEFKIVEYTSGSGGSWDGTPIVTGTTDDGNAQITFDATDIACGYKVVTFYYGGSSANVQ